MRVDSQMIDLQTVRTTARAWLSAALAAVTMGLAADALPDSGNANTTAEAGISDSSIGLRVKTGYNYTIGNYGTTATTQIRAIPLDFTWETGNYAFALSLAYLDLKAPTDTVIVNGLPVFVEGANAPIVTQHGWDDPVASVTRFVLNEEEQWIDFDVTGQVKVPVNHTLGTGKFDLNLQADLSKTTGRLLSTVTLGYYIPGKAADLDLVNYWHLSVDEAVRVTGPFKVGAAYYLGQPITDGGPSQSELTAYVTYQIAQYVKFELYYLKGFSNGSPAHGAGGFVTVYF